MTVQNRKLDGAEFVFSNQADVPALWGHNGAEVLWAPGEALMIVGPDGVGKSTLLQQLMLARLGITTGLLGMPVQPAEGRVLYLAMDRPAQAQRSMRRMVGEHDEKTLRDGLSVWRGPLPIDPVGKPVTLADWIAVEFPGTTDVFIDSIKDLAPKVAEDETGAKLNLARQELLARGIQCVENHHQRKEQRGSGKPTALADVYGSRWLTAGAGSVILLWGDAGDSVVELIHLKQPSEPFGPHKIIHNHTDGATSLYEPGDIARALENAAGGMLVADAARVMFESSTPSPNETEKARRKLNRLVKDGHATSQTTPDGSVRYHWRNGPREVRDPKREGLNKPFLQNGPAPFAGSRQGHDHHEPAISSVTQGVTGVTQGMEAKVTEAPHTPRRGEGPNVGENDREPGWLSRLMEDA